MIMQSAILLQNNPSPSEDDIRQSLANNLCRCGSHLSVIRAVQLAATMSA
jgi:nicotinate dehydrogenase subunit A